MFEHVTWPFAIIEGGNYIVVLICLISTWKKARHLTVLIIAAFLFGYVLEYSAVKAGNLYEYHHWFIPLPGPVPLGISLSWGVIMFAVWRASDSLGLPFLVRPVFAGLLAVGVDWVMDPAFVYLKFWTWVHPGEWYGIPWRNFPSWFMVVLCFVLWVQIAYHFFPPAKHKLWVVTVATVVSTLPAFVMLFVTMKTYYWLADLQLSWLPEYRMIILVFGSAVAVVARYLPRGRRTNPIDIVALIPAFYICISALVAIFLSGCHVQNQELIIVAPVFVFTTLALYMLPHLETLRRF
jgi:Carotenoid biosynthesis protein